ncbi:PIN-like domain-containing protein [Paenibacillus illinoisensis]|uniref:PIN-like domain-containing protein n=1 Tax=Paenibacillus illinoisensis TaxID=59845 RepID=UPI003AFB63A6
MLDNFDNFKKVWDSDPLIVLDTNVFLRLYSQSPDVINQYIEILRSAKDKIWYQHKLFKSLKITIQKSMVEIPLNTRYS